MVRGMSKVVLSLETKSKISNHIKRHWKQPRECPICKSTNWYIQPGGLFQPIQEVFTLDDRKTNFIATDGSIPTIQALCNTCFYVHTFLLMPILDAQGAGND